MSSTILKPLIQRVSCPINLDICRPSLFRHVKDYLQSASHVVQNFAFGPPSKGFSSATIPTIEAQFELHPIWLLLGGIGGIGISLGGFVE